jgi:RHS repeat-associated protein
VIEQYRYDAFGGILTGITAPYNTVGYTGHHYDNKSGLIDMKARWYDPAAGRFSTPDTYPGTLHEPFTQHRYAYVGNNPINMWDPTGHVPQWVRNPGFDANWNETSSTVSLDLRIITNYTPYDSGWQYTHTEKTIDYHYKHFKRTEYEEWEYIHLKILWDRLVDKETGNEYLEEKSSSFSRGTFSELSVYHYRQTIPASELAILNREMIKNHGDPPADAKPTWTTSAINGQVIENNPLLSIHSNNSNLQTQMVQSQLNDFLNVSKSLTVDGKFGGLTERAIRGVQKELGIPQNGIFNTQTLYQIEMAMMAKNTPVVMGKQAQNTPAQNSNSWLDGHIANSLEMLDIIFNVNGERQNAWSLEGEVGIGYGAKFNALGIKAEAKLVSLTIFANRDEVGHSVRYFNARVFEKSSI